jgi:thiamine-phosphate pyrophosphorylase
MDRRQPLPRLWLMTDERQGEGLWRALGRIPPGSGIVFRHCSLPKGERKRLFEGVRRIARRRRLLLVVAGDGLRADGRHNRRGGNFRTASAHGLRELRQAEAAGVALVFLSPAYATRSHPGDRPLGPARFGLIARQARVPVIALGGVDEKNARRLPHIYGWAAIDAWTD